MKAVEFFSEPNKHMSLHRCLYKLRDGEGAPGKMLIEVVEAVLNLIWVIQKLVNTTFIIIIIIINEST